MDDERLFGRENRLGIVSVIHKPGGRNQEKFLEHQTNFCSSMLKTRAWLNLTSSQEINLARLALISMTKRGVIV